MANQESKLPGVNVAIEDVNVKQRFEEKFIINPETHCWEWIAGQNGKGYGAFWYKGKMYPAAQISYRIYKGEYLTYLQVLHTCRTKHCVNPDHLYIGTQADNMKDVAKDQTHHLLKIDRTTAIRLRKEGYTLLAIGKVFNTSKEAVFQMLRRAGI